MLSADQDVDAPTGLAASFMIHRASLHAFVRARIGRGGDGAEVEDVMQELWLRSCAVETADIGDPRSYLFRMGHNLILNGARELARRRHREADWGYVNGRDGDGVEEAGAERSLLAREQLHTIDKALSAVGARAARAFRRYRIDGIDQRRIAAELNVSLSTIEKDLRAAYAALLAVRGRPDEEPA